MKGVVAAGSRQTANAAAEVLRAGGGAIDALVAGALASYVAEPMLASAGGAGLLSYAPHDGEPVVLDFFSEAPGKGLGERPEAHFEDVTIDFGPASQVFHVGRGAAAVPLALPGLLMAATELGRMPLSDLIVPAVELARGGVTLTEDGAMPFKLLWPILRLDPEVVELYGHRGGPPPPGTVLTNPAFADTLVELARLGRVPDAVNEGLVAAFGFERGGLITAEDLRVCAPALGPPFTLTLGDLEVLTSPLPGGRVLGVILTELCREEPHGEEPAEVARIARASLAGHRARTAFTSRGSTTHLSAIDADGNAAAMTLTNGEGCGHLIPGTGIQVNNFLGEEDLNPAGFHRHAPGTRLPTMLAPTVVRRHGEPLLALGSGGANRIRSAVSQVLYRAAVLGHPLIEAVEAPRVHAEDGAVWLELEGLLEPEQAVSELRADFAEVCPFPSRAFFFGGVHAVMREGSRIVGVGDPRRGGAVVEV